MTLGLVRAAQGRDQEAEELLRDAYDRLGPEHRLHLRDALEALAAFLHDRGRDDEAAELDERRQQLVAEAERATSTA
jgi:hypothetical protein